MTGADAADAADANDGAVPEGGHPEGGDAGRLFRPDRKLTEVIGRGRFTLSAEVTPPRNGAEQAVVLQQVGQLVAAGAQFLAVTRGAGGSLRGGSLPIAQAIKERFGVPAVAHFTCRDLTPEEVENQLVDHHYFGIRNLLALRGDPPDGQPQWEARPVPTPSGVARWRSLDPGGGPGGYRYAYQLLEQARGLNEGRYLPRPSGPPAGGRERTDFDLGAAAYPEHGDAEEGLRFFARKLEAGARFAITQMVFDPAVYGRFLDRCERRGLHVPVLPGTRVLRTRGQARRTAAKYGVSVPPDLLEGLRGADRTGAPGGSDAGDNKSLDLFARLVERLREYGAPGVHLFVTDTATACGLLRHLGGSSK